MAYRPDPWQEFWATLPSWPLVLRLRTATLRRRLAHCGSDVVLAQGAILRYPERITIGSRVFINRGTTITARAPIHIGDDVLIGPHVVIDSGNHNFSDTQRLINSQGYNRAPITIGSDVWIGAKAMILPGTTLGVGSVIAASAVVTRDIPPTAVAAGVPARVIRYRGDDIADSR
jgi:acetyltransferase-like isoleucine patch superfamily enzyme